MADTIITVQGEYELRHPAERGAVRLRVAYDGPARDEVLALTTQRQLSLACELRDLHDPQSGPVIQWSSDQLRVWGERPWSRRRAAARRGAPRRGRHRRAVQRPRPRSPTGSAWSRCSTASTSTGVTWSLTEARRQSLTQEARRRAVENAVAKATVYATSLGLSSVKPLALSDPGMLGDGSAPGQPPQPLFARAVSADAGGATLALKPEELTIAVQVHARFSAG